MITWSKDELDKIRHLLKVQVSRSSQVRGPHGTRIRSVRHSLSRQAVAGLSAKGDRSRRSGRVMWSGSRPAKSTGTGYTGDGDDAYRHSGEAGREGCRLDGTRQ